MPPRRKRNKSSARPQLTFTESPVHKIHNLPSPVFASDHPAFADVIPIDPGSVSWVSPQFTGPASSRKTRRGTRIRRASHYDDPQNDSTPSNQPAQRITRCRSYMPLQMQNDIPTQNVPLTAVEEDKQSPANVGYRTRSRSRSSLPVEEVLQGSGKRSNKKSPGLTQGRPARERRKKPSRLNFDDSYSNEAAGLEAKCDKGAANPSSSFTAQGFADVDTPPACTLSTPERQPTRTSSCACPPESSSPLSRRRSRRISNNIFKDLLEKTVVCDCEENENCPRVLVYDTPESEYGKKIRWKQLNKGRRKSRSKKRSS